MTSPPRAQSARHDPSRNTIEVVMSDELVLAFPVESGEGLRDASPEQLARVVLIRDGQVLRWDDLDVEVTVLSLVMGPKA